MKPPTTALSGNRCDSVKDMLRKTVGEVARDHVMKARESSVFTEQGRIFLDAAAMAYDAHIDEDGNIVDARGTVLDDKNPDYVAIVNIAKRQARAESPIGRELIGP